MRCAQEYRRFPATPFVHSTRVECSGVELPVASAEMTEWDWNGKPEDISWDRKEENVLSIARLLCRTTHERACESERGARLSVVKFPDMVLAIGPSLMPVTFCSVVDRIERQ